MGGPFKRQVRRSNKTNTSTKVEAKSTIRPASSQVEGRGWSHPFKGSRKQLQTEKEVPGLRTASNRPGRSPRTTDKRKTLPA